MSALLDFTSHVTVLPPGCWDKNNRIEPPKVMPAKVTEINISKLILSTENKKNYFKKIRWKWYSFVKYLSNFWNLNRLFFVKIKHFVNFPRTQDQTQNRLRKWTKSRMKRKMVTTPAWNERAGQQCIYMYLVHVLSSNVLHIFILIDFLC